MQPDLKHVIQQNFVVNNTFAARHDRNIDVRLNDDFLRTDCGLPSDTFNVAIPLRDNPTDELYAAMVTAFTARGLPMALWLWDFLPQWRAYLGQSPLPLAETNLGMYAAADTLRIVPELPQDFSIRKVTTGADVLDFAGVMAAVFGQSAEADNVRRYYARLAHSGFYNDSATKMYVGYRNGRAVSTGSIIITAEATGIYDIATLESERNRGLGSAMFHHILKEIQNMGHPLCVLQASPMGAGIYRRAGFETACEVFIFENRELLSP